MKNFLLFLMLAFFLFSCSKTGQKKPDFSPSIIYAEAQDKTNGRDFTSAIINAQKEAVKIAFKSFADDQQAGENSINFFMDNYGFYVKKYKILKKEVKDGTAKVSIKVYFLTDRFISALRREKKTFSKDIPKLAFYTRFHPEYDSSLNNFKKAFENTDYPEFYFPNSKIEDKQDKSFDYIVVSDIYSYSLNPSPELSSVYPVISSGTFRIFETKNTAFQESFELEENSIGNTMENAISMTLVSLGMRAKEKITDLIREKEKRKRKVNLIFSNVKDINTLLKIRNAVSTLPVSGFFIKNFYDDQAVFVVEDGKISNEEISSFIIRADFTPLYVDYIDKEEIKFVLMGGYI